MADLEEYILARNLFIARIEELQATVARQERDILELVRQNDALKKECVDMLMQKYSELI